MGRKDFPEFGPRLRALRLERRLTIEQAAEAVGIERVVMNRYELGIRVPETAHALASLCRLYNVSSDYLLGLIDERRPWPPQQST